MTDFEDILNFDRVEKALAQRSFVVFYSLIFVLPHCPPPTIINTITQLFIIIIQNIG